MLESRVHKHCSQQVEVINLLGEKGKRGKGFPGDNTGLDQTNRHLPVHRDSQEPGREKSLQMEGSIWGE